MKNRLTVFISYSWDNPEHQEWVLKLANYLIEKAGCNVLLDQFDLAAGKELTLFMENGLEKADKVLIILTEGFKTKADNREGGTGFEYSLISQGLYDLQSNNNKFIPVLRQGTKATSAPVYLGTKIYHSMKDDSKFENDAFNLSRLIYEKPEIIRPELGAIPDFNNPDYDPIIASANELSRKEKLNQELDQLLRSSNGVILAKDEVDLLYEQIEEKAKHYTKETDFIFKTERDGRNLLLTSGGYSVTITYKNLASNWVKDSELRIKMWHGFLSIKTRIDYFPEDKPKLIADTTYLVDFNDLKQVVWRNKDKTNIVTESQKLNRAAFVYITQSIQQEKEKNFRK